MGCISLRPTPQQCFQNPRYKLQHLPTEVLRLSIPYLLGNMTSLRFLVAIMYIGISTSFVRISYISNGVPSSKNLRMSENADSASIGDIIESIKGTPQRISDTTARISGTIQAAPGQISRNVKDATDAVIYFPSNVTASVIETQSNIVERSDNVKRKVKALSPLPFINNAFKFTKSIIDTAYELKDGKINENKAIMPQKAKIVKSKPEKSAGEAYEEAKENFYLTVDSINDFGRGVAATVDRVQQIPNDITKTKESVVLTAEIIQQDIAEKQQQAQEIGKVVWKVITLEAAKETYERTEKQYQNTVKYVSDTKTMLQTNPKAIFSGGVKAETKKVPPTPVPVPVPEVVPVVVPVKKEDTSLDKIWGAIKVTKAGLDATVTTVKSVSKGVKGLKKRIDKDIAQQAASASGIPLPVSSMLLASAPALSPVDDSSELTYSSSTSILSAPTPEIPDEVEVITEDIIATIPMDNIADVTEVTEVLPIETIEASNDSTLTVETPVSTVDSSIFIDTTPETEPIAVSVSVSEVSAE